MQVALEEIFVSIRLSFWIVSSSGLFLRLAGFTPEVIWRNTVQIVFCPNFSFWLSLQTAVTIVSQSFRSNSASVVISLWCQSWAQRNLWQKNEIVKSINYYKLDMITMWASVTFGTNTFKRSQKNGKIFPDRPDGRNFLKFNYN